MRTLSEETKKKISDSLKGHIPWNKGMKNPYSEEQLKRLSNSHKGNRQTEETKRKISEKMKGENNPFYGKKHSEEDVKKMRKNHSGGTPIGFKHTDEMRRKLSEVKKGKKMDEETKKKISKANKGKCISEKQRKQISEARKGMKFTEEHRKKIGESKRGIKLTEEHKRKISKGNKGRDAWNKDKSCSEETKRKLRISSIRRIEEQIKNGGQIKPNYNMLACKIFEDINKTYNLLGQHAENGGEYKVEDLGYFLDYFDKRNLVIIEYYEKHHYKDENILTEKTLQREKEIKEYFPHYQFLRINAYDKNNLRIENVS